MLQNSFEFIYMPHWHIQVIKLIYMPHWHKRSSSILFIFPKKNYISYLFILLYPLLRKPWTKGYMVHKTARKILTYSILL